MAGGGCLYSRDRVCIVRVRKLLACSEDLVLVPRFFVVLEWAVEWRELAGHNELGDDRLVPVFGTGVNALGHESTVVDGFVVVSPPR